MIFLGFYIGLDLGQSADYSALVIVEEAERPQGSDHGVLYLRYLKRWPLRTPYPQIADDVAEIMNDEQLKRTPYDPYYRRRILQEPELLVDNTGVGTAVTDLLKERNVSFKAITITAGHQVHPMPGGYSVPKKNLIASVEVPLHYDALIIHPDLELAPVLRQELLGFRRKVSLTTGHDTYEHWREGDHDDLVLATALACWGARDKPGRGAELFVF